MCGYPTLSKILGGFEGASAGGVPGECGALFFSCFVFVGERGVSVFVFECGVFRVLLSGGVF